MHKGVILLLKADDRDEAENKANEFMEQYQNNVWDWYELGGRWTGLLDKYEPSKDQKNIEVCDLCGGTGKRTDMKVENGCNKCRGTGKALKWPTQWEKHDGDILPLSQCLPAVKEFAGDFVKNRIKELKAYGKSSKGNGTKGYVMKCIGALLSEDFCFNCNVYNVEEYNYSIPTDQNGWWAVVIDMHN